MGDESIRRELSHRFRLLIRKTKNEYSRNINEGISNAQYTMLTILRDEGSCSCTELAERIYVTLPAVTNLANKLVESGWAERLPQPSDRRAVLLRITESGEALLARIDVKVNEVIDRLWNKLDAEEVEQFERLLGKLLN
ncbi:MarR family winged helix-turn-helix transcriptional regulator [Paenibacillus chartarius]|uniref:MarR family winged helix-turn-helix transcriptional regulator n=1 Tax=Paenibacillus chartarius TaxID=747481 RepID=A0ABV6DQU2_9BACL